MPFINTKKIKFGVVFFAIFLLFACAKMSDTPTAATSSKLALRSFKVMTTGGLFNVGNASVAGSPNFVTDSNGNIFYPDTNHFRIAKVDIDGVETTFAGGLIEGILDGTGTAAQLARPYALGIDGTDNIYVADYGTYNIRKISPAGVVSTFVTINSGNFALGFTADKSGNLYYSETVPGGWTSSNIIKKISTSGVISTLAGSGSAGNTNSTGTAASFNDPHQLVVDYIGNVFVCDVGNFKIMTIKPSVEVSTFAGSGSQAILDGSGLNAAFYFYQTLGNLTIDSTDTIYVGDMAGDTGYIRTIDKDGNVEIFCGSGSTTSINSGTTCNDTGIWINGGITITPNGSIYFIAGQTLYRITK
jgi:hypothetical protein